MKKLILIILITFLFYSSAFCQYGKGQIEKPSKGQKKANKGQYTETGNVQKHPYTIFVKTKENYTSMADEIENIRLSIVNDIDKKDFKKKYKDIFTSGLLTFDNSNDTAIGGHDFGAVSPSSKKCKNAAFVYLMGFYKDGKVNFLRAGENDSTLFKGSPEHNGFKTRAIERLQYMNIDVGWSYNVNSHQWRTKEFIHYLQAYDYLKAAGVVSDSLEDAKYSLNIFNLKTLKLITS